MTLFKHLTAAEEQSFRNWARANYRPFEPINGVWHPVTQDECVKMNAETGYAPVRRVSVELGGANDQTT